MAHFIIYAVTYDFVDLCAAQMFELLTFQDSHSTTFSIFKSAKICTGSGLFISTEIKWFTELAAWKQLSDV